MVSGPNRPLFEAYPGLRKRVPFVPLASLPTPLERMHRLSAETGADIWVKRDGQTHPVYGGNKIRKFEFVFGDILRQGAKAVLTGGGLGSHHNVATAVVCREFDLQPVCSYYCQPVTEEVRHHLAVSVPLEIDAHFCGDYVGLVASFIWQYLVWFLKTRRLPYFIYPGAPGTLGSLGYVNAAFEIKAQLETLDLPDPEAIFVPVGSCGTFAGLLLGARLAGLTSKVLGVRIIEEDVANRQKIARIVNRTARYMQRRDPNIPLLRVGMDEVDLVDGYVGLGYAHPSPEALRAVEWVSQAEGLQLETTYTGKAMAALLDYAESHPGANILFIDTFTESQELEKGDWRALPQQFWPVFEAASEARCWCLRSWRDPQFCWRKQPRSD